MTSSAASGAAATDAAGAAGGTAEDRAGSSTAVNAGVGVQAVRVSMCGLRGMTPAWAGVSIDWSVDGSINAITLPSSPPPPPPSHFPQADRPQASSGEQAASLKESWQIDEGAEALAAERLQRWWRAERRVGRTAAALLAQAEQLERYERMIV